MENTNTDTVKKETEKRPSFEQIKNGDCTLKELQLAFIELAEIVDDNARTSNKEIRRIQGFTI